MFHQVNRSSLQSPLKILCISVLHLLLTHSCRGQSQLIGPSKPVLATVAGDIILPCHLEPAEDVSGKTVEWTRADVKSNVLVWRVGQEVINAKHASYQRRASLFNEELKQGNVSLKLSNVKLSDGGKYKCNVSHIKNKFDVELIVGHELIGPSQPIVATVGDDIVLPCQLKPAQDASEVTVEWTRPDSKPNTLVHHAGPKSMKDIHPSYQGRTSLPIEELKQGNISLKLSKVKLSDGGKYECHIPYVNKSFVELNVRDLNVQSSSTPAVIGLAVTLVVCMVFYIAVFFYVWKWRQNMIKKMKHYDEVEGGGDPEMQPMNAAETQRREEAEEEIQTLKKELEMTKQELQSTKEKEKEKEQEVETLKEELQTKTKEIEEKQVELQQLRDENQRKEANNTEIILKQTLQVEQQRREKAEKEVHTLNQELVKKNKELQDEQQRREEMHNKEKELQDKISKMKEKQIELLKEKHDRGMEMKDLRKEIENKQAECDLLMKLQQLNEENQKRIETDLEILKEKLETKTRELDTMKDGWFKGAKKKEKAEKEQEVETLKKELQIKQEGFESKTKEIKEIQAELQQLRENQKKETDKKKSFRLSQSKR